MRFPLEPQQRGDSFGFAAWRGLSRVMAVSHSHNDIEINFSASPLTYDSLGRTSTLPAGRPFAFWGAKHHRLVEMEGDEPLGFVTVPLATFMSWEVPSTVTRRLLHGDVLVGPDEGFDWLGSALERWAVDLDCGGEMLRKAAALEVQGLLARLSTGTWAELRTGSERSTTDLRRAADMATYIAAHARSELRVVDVAACIHLHPNRAASIFRDVFGVSIRSYVQRYRVAEAQRLLVTTDLDSAGVAVEAGFGSLSSYHEAFASVCGTSPTRWRREHLGTT